MVTINPVCVMMLMMVVMLSRISVTLAGTSLYFTKNFMFLPLFRRINILTRYCCQSQKWYW